MIPIVKSVITPSSQLFQSISDFFFSGCFRFLLLICFSPPVYNISYGVPYVKCFFRKYAKKCLLSGTFRISERKKLFDYSQQRQHLLPIGKSGVEPESTVRNAVCFSLKLHSVSRHQEDRRLFSNIRIYASVCSCILFITYFMRT